jgi:hypothetical protein
MEYHDAYAGAEDIATRRDHKTVSKHRPKWWQHVCRARIKNG